MVNFSDHMAIKHWIDRIELAEGRREVAVALAARAALRVAPLLSGELMHDKRNRGEILSTLILPTLRAAALSWVAGKYPAHGNELHGAAYAASVAAADAADRADDISAASVAFAARSASFGARGAVDSAPSTMPSTLQSVPRVPPTSQSPSTHSPRPPTPPVPTTSPSRSPPRSQPTPPRSIRGSPAPSSLVCLSGRPVGLTGRPKVGED